MNFDLVEFYADWQTILPECFLLVWAFVITMMAVFTRNRGEGTSTGSYAVWTLIGVVITAVWVALTPDGEAFGGTFVFDRLAVLFKEIVLGGVLLTVISSIGPVDRMKLHRGEFYGLLLFSAVGMMLMVSATELLLLYIAIELSTVTLFVLAAYRKANRKSAEAGLEVCDSGRHFLGRAALRCGAHLRSHSHRTGCGGQRNWAMCSSRADRSRRG
jgi:NADH-quinone oxidoreductase subunit N